MKYNNVEWYVRVENNVNNKLICINIQVMWKKQANCITHYVLQQVCKCCPNVERYYKLQTRNLQEFERGIIILIRKRKK